MDLGLCVQTLRGVVFIAGGFGAASLQLGSTLADQSHTSCLKAKITRQCSGFQRNCKTRKEIAVHASY